MQRDITENIATGRDLSVDNFLIAVAKEAGLFTKGELAEIINSETCDQFVGYTGRDVSYFRDKIAKAEKRITAAKQVFAGLRLSKQIEEAEAEIAYYRRDMKATEKSNAVDREFAEALYDNLPDRVVREKRKRLEMRAPHEMGDIFGDKYRAIGKVGAEEEIALLKEIEAMLTDPKGGKKLAKKKQDFDKKSTDYIFEGSRAIRARYDGMIKHVTGWYPMYDNPLDAHMEHQVQAKLENHKRLALSALENGREENCCPEKDIRIRENDAENSESETPEDCLAGLRFRVINRMDFLNALLEKQNSLT